ncbi:Glycine-rich RNA-binding protein 3, mitochondrial, partial [Zea mays]
SALFSLILTNSGQTTIAVLASKNIVSPVRRIPVGGSSQFIICISFVKILCPYNFLIAANIVLGLSYGTDDHSLRDEFAKYGEVVEGIKLIAALGGLLKNGMSSNLSVYQAIRCMSSSKLFVGGLSYGTDDHSLRVEFAKYGEVVEGTLFIVALALALLFADQLCFNLSN